MYYERLDNSIEEAPENNETIKPNHQSKPIEILSPISAVNNPNTKTYNFYDSIFNPKKELKGMATKIFEERVAGSDRNLRAVKAQNVSINSILIDLYLEDLDLQTPSAQSVVIFNILNETQKQGELKALHIIENLNYFQIDMLVKLAAVKDKPYELKNDFISEEIVKRYTRFYVNIERSPRWKILSTVESTSSKAGKSLVETALNELRHIRPNKFEKLENRFGFRFSNIPVLKRFSKWMYRQE